MQMFSTSRLYLLTMNVKKDSRLNRSLITYISYSNSLASPRRTKSNVISCSHDFYEKKSRFAPITDWIEVDSTILNRHYTQKTFITINRLILFLIHTSLLIIVLLSKSTFCEDCSFIVEAIL